MQYNTKETKEEIDMISLTRSEYDELNRVYREGIRKRFNNSKSLEEIDDITRIILTDGWHRMDFLINKNAL